MLFSLIYNKYIRNSLQNRDINIHYTNKFNTKSIYAYTFLWPTDFSLTSVNFDTKKIPKIVDLFLGILIYYDILYQIRLYRQCVSLFD